MLNQNLTLKSKGESVMKLFKKKSCCQCSVDEIKQAEETKNELGIKILGSGCASCIRNEYRITNRPYNRFCPNCILWYNVNTSIGLKWRSCIFW